MRKCAKCDRELEEKEAAVVRVVYRDIQDWLTFEEQTVEYLCSEVCLNDNA